MRPTLDVRAAKAAMHVEGKERRRWIVIDWLTAALVVITGIYAYLTSEWRTQPIVPSSRHRSNLTRRGQIGLTAVDITESWQLGSRVQVRSALQALEQFGRLKHRGGADLDRKHKRGELS